MTLPTLNLGPDLEATLASGHTWVYRNRLPRHNLQTGQWLRLEAGRSSAVGLYDDEGQIAVRLFHPDRVPDDGLLKARAVEALALRAGLEAKENDAYRLINGEGDGLPGIVIDRYGRFAVVKTVASSVEKLAPTLAAAVAKAGRLRGVMHRRSEGHEILWGAPPPPEITVRENGLRFIANVHEGQKTGLFLDQRDNRQTVREQALGRRVLNLFSYSGAFGVYALAGGAEHVTDVDQAAPALRDAERNVAANDLDLHRHETVQADAHDFLRDQVATGRRYDLVILDPPSLARGRRHRYAALRAYRRLNSLAFKLLTPGGLLATASCTAQVPPEAFREVLAEAAREAGRQAQIVHEAAHASDHPVPLHFPEGRYLKFLLLRALEPR